MAFVSSKSMSEKASTKFRTETAMNDYTKPENSAPLIHNILAQEPPNDLFRSEDTDWLLAKDLNSMSMEEREKVSHDIHAIAENHEDTPEFLNNKLDEMEKALKEQLNRKNAYDLALSMDSEYVTNKPFVLKFLRAEQYEPYKAALLFVRHLDCKLELFGSEKICSDITQDDLDQGTVDYLYSGQTQALPLPDMAGRVVTVSFVGGRWYGYTPEQKLRKAFYHSMVLAEDEEAQKKGRVMIFWFEKPNFDRSASWKLGQLTKSVPFRVAAVHLCIPYGEGCGDFFDDLVSFSRLAVSSAVRVRIRTHRGSPTEIKYILQSFGIPVQTLPINSEGEIAWDAANKTWAARREEERRRRNALSTPKLHKVPEPQRVVTPSNLDILLGRGRPGQRHIGNMKFRYLIEEKQEAYDNASKQVKTLMAAEIVRHVHRRNGRFLKKEGSGWVQVDEYVARTKVSTCFRTSRHRKKVEEHPKDIL